MARKHPNPIDNPPAASSSEEEEEEEVVEEEEEMQSEEEPVEVEGEEEEEEEEGEEEEEEEEEEEDDKAELKTEKIHPQPSKVEGEEEEEEEEGEEEEEEEEEDEEDDDKAELKTEKIHPQPSKSTPSSKRPAETNNSRSISKKAKSENGGGEDKKPIRVWSEADEIAILKALIDFHQDRKLDSTSDSIEFHEFVQDRLSVKSSKSQVMEKVRRLKKKYKNTAAKTQDGKDPVYSRPHEHKCYHLSKQIWGGDSTPQKTPSRKKKNPAADFGIAKTILKDEPAGPLCNNNDQASNVHAGNFSQLYPFLHLSLSKCNFSADMVSKHGVDAMASSLSYLNKPELEQLEKDWKNQILAESELFSKRAILLQKQIKLIRDCNS